MYSVMHILGYDTKFDAATEQKVALRLLEAVVTSLDLRRQRQQGVVLQPADLGPKPSAAKTWTEIFEAWRDYVVDRPKPTTIAAQTAWWQLEAFAKKHGATCPAHVTPLVMRDFVKDMEKRLSVSTVNDRLCKVRAIYAIAIGLLLLTDNPAANTLGLKIPSHMKGRIKRKAFSYRDLRLVFGSSIYTQHLRSFGQSKEASYWIPLLMYYTGARPEELAGLELDDLLEAPNLGRYIRVTDLPCPSGDAGLFEEEEEGSSGKKRSEPVADLGASEVEKKRFLKNHASRRNLPLAQELIELGWLDYVEHVKARSDGKMVFPDLRPDTHGKLSGAHGKFFGRQLRELGISDANKTLYSLRHTMKDFLEAAEVPTKYLKRIMGHASGDGTVTDGYGSGVPTDLLFKHFRTIKFHPIPALRWEPGRGTVRNKTAVE